MVSYPLTASYCVLCVFFQVVIGRIGNNQVVIQVVMVIQWVIALPSTISSHLKIGQAIVFQLSISSH